MNYNKVRKRLRRKRRKNVMRWYRWYKRILKSNEYVLVHQCIMGLPSDGQMIAAKLLCRKNKQLEIDCNFSLLANVRGVRLVWKSKTI